jgi:hypothetical protein
VLPSLLVLRKEGSRRRGCSTPPSRNAEFRGSLAENWIFCCVTRHPEPYSLKAIKGRVVCHLPTRGSPHAVDVFSWVIRWVVPYPEPYSLKAIKGRVVCHLPTRGSPHAVDVFSWVIRWVVLDDPVHGGDVQPARRHVRAQQDALRARRSRLTQHLNTRVI